MIAAALSSPAYSQGAPTTPPASAHAPPVLGAIQVDLPLLATGYRTSRVVGSTIVNAADDPLATLDDLIVTPDARVSYAVLSVGGFLGVNARHVIVPYSALEVHENRVVLRDGTRETLKALPEFKYGS
jgi:hypothetical protein